VLHPHTELRAADERIGLGVFATRPIPRGTIIWVLDRLDQVVPCTQVERFGQAYEALLERYAFRNAEGAWILCWDFARLVNHSCDANSLSTGWDFDVAVRDIAAGEEITNDYASLNLDAPFRCCCEALGCRRWVEPGDFERLDARWDELVKDAFTDVARVAQPLWQWLSQKREVRRASARVDRVPSIRRHRFVSHPGALSVPAASARATG
jgi:hypothetical protein